MIHEVLFHLWNHPEITEENDAEWLSDLNEFLHPGENTILQKISEIATKYHDIRIFIKNVSVLMTKSISDEIVVESGIQPGLYIKAFCNGLDEVLDEYRTEILKLEEKFLNNPQLSLTIILSTLQKFVLPFDAMLSMIGMVKRQKLHGCLIIGKLHNMYLDCGVESVTRATEKIIQNVNIIFYRHLCNWVIYGDLYDVYNEFFICDANCPDEDFLHPSDVTDSSRSEVSLKKSRIKKPAIVRMFYIRPELLPSNLPSDLAETILFMGRIVWIIRNKPESCSDEKYSLQIKKDVWDGKDVEYYKSLQSLESAAFNLPAFEKKLEDCMKKLTQFLWKTMLDEANLPEHLQLIRDYYGLGRGELFQQFIMVGQEQLKEARNHNIMRNLNFIFSETARKIYTENDKTYQRFELSLAGVNSGVNPWDTLEINFDIRWPLHIVFHPRAMALYNKLFCFLLKLKKTGIDLHKLWLLHMEGKRKIDHRVWTLRHNLMFIVNNLQYYFEVDVIEAQFSILQKAVKNANEFEDIIKLHSNFLTNLLSKTFVMVVEDTQNVHKFKLYQIPAVNFSGKNNVYAVIMKILKLCDEFCVKATFWDSELTEVELAELQNLRDTSETLIEMLLQMLYSLHERSSGQHLLQLLYQLDFNRWFSKTKPDFNLSLV